MNEHLLEMVKVIRVDLDLKYSNQINNLKGDLSNLGRVARNLTVACVVLSIGLIGLTVWTLIK